MFFLNLKNSYLVFLFSFLFFSIFNLTYSTENTLSVEINEFPKEIDSYNPSSYWILDNSTNTYFGEIKIENINPSGEHLSDIYIYLDNASYSTNFTLISGSFVNITKISNDEYLIHIPELLNTNLSFIRYDILNNVTAPLFFNTSYTKNKLFVGDSINIVDSITNTFNNQSYQNSCVYNISIIQNLISIGDSAFDSFTYQPATIAGADSANIVFSGSDKILTWNVNSNSCLNSHLSLDINYNITAPTYIPTSGNFNFSNITLSYNMNETFSNLRVKEILAISAGNLSLNKKIVNFSNNLSSDTNVTWQVNGTFENPTSLNYLLETSSFWVSQKGVDSLYTNISKIDIDGIDSSVLQLNLTPNIIVNSTNPWISNNWFFNYSSSPSPITWLSVNFTLVNDGIQLINSSYSKSGNSTFTKQIYLVIGYLLEIDKNITSIGNNLYNVKIDVLNRGNQATPVDSIVTIYDFVPSNFSIVSPFSYSSSTWNSPTSSSNVVSGGFSGNLIQWAVIPTNSINVSFDKGPIKNLNNSLTISYNISGSGDYNLMDVFITGLDPERVDGAGSSKAIIFEEIYNKITGFQEYSFVVLSSILFSLILLV